MSAKSFGSINVISGLIFVLLGATMAIAGYSELEDLFDYGDFGVGLILISTGYLFIIVGLWGVLCGIVATVVGLFNSN